MVSNCGPYLAVCQLKSVIGTLDWSAVVSGSRVAAGLDPFDSAKVCLMYPFVNVN